MMDIGISSLEFARIKHSNSPDAIVWLFDGNISYYTGKHIFFVYSRLDILFFLNCVLYESTFHPVSSKKVKYLLLALG